MTLGLQFHTVAQEYYFELIETEQDFYSNNVNEFYKDTLGFIWFNASPDGLIRYDGRRFRNYRKSAKSQKLPSNNIMSLTHDGRNGIFTATTDGGLLKYIRDEDLFAYVPLKGVDHTPIFRNITTDEAGSVWAVDDFGGIYSIIEDTLCFHPELNSKRSHILQIKCAPSNRIFYLADTSLFKLNQNAKGSEKIIDFTRTNLFAPTDNLVNMTFEPGFVWLAAASNNLYKVSMFNYKQVKSFDLGVLLGVKTPIQIVHIQKEPDKNVIWISTSNHGLIAFNYKDETCQNFRMEEFVEGALPSDNIRCSFFDPQKNLWVGTSAGIVKYSPSRVRFKKYQRTPVSNFTLKDDFIWSFFESNDSTILIGTQSSGLLKFDPVKENFSPLKTFLNNQLFNPLVYEYFVLDKDNFFLATKSGILQLNIKTGVLNYPSFMEGHPDKEIKTTSIKRYKGKYMLAGTSFGFVIYDLVEKQFKYNYIPRKLSTRYDGLGIKSIFIDSDNHIWLAFFKEGLMQYDLETSTFTSYLNDKNRPGSLSVNDVMSIKEYNRKLYVGCFNGGINILDLDKKDEKGELIDEFEHINSSDGLIDETIYTINFANDMIWVSTNKGISSYNLLTKTAQNYSKADGIQGYEFNMKAELVEQKGRIYLGGTKGFNVIDNTTNFIDTSNAQVYISSVEVLSTSDSANAPLREIFTANRYTLSFPSDTRYLKFNFHYPHYTNPERNTFRYQLLGSSEKWMALGGKDFIELTNLPPGNYRLNVEAANRDGVLSANTASLSFSIDLPFWMDWRYYFIGLIFLTVTIYFNYRKNLTTEKVKQKELEKEITSRTLQLLEKSSELENINKALEGQMRSRDVFFSILSHDLRSPLTTLKGLLTLLSLNPKALTIYELKDMQDKISGSIDSSLLLIDNILHWYNTSQGRVQVQKEVFSVKELLKEQINIYRAMADKKKIAMVLENQKDDIMLHADRQMISVIIRNFVSNALKFTYLGGKVHVNFNSEYGMIKISVTDNGMGMSREEIDALFDEEKNIQSKGTQGEKGTGLGLLLCKRFAELNKGRIEVKSQVNAGSAFSLILTG